MLLTLFSDTNYLFSHWEITFFSVDGTSCTATFFLVVISRDLWEEDCIMQQKQKFQIMR